MEKKVLIVEDDSFILTTVSRKFGDSGFTPLFAKNVEDARTLLTTTIPDCILLDIILPGESGLELLKYVKADQKLLHIPVIIFSNLGSDDEIKTALSLGAQDYIIKANLTPDKVVEKIKNFLSTHTTA